MTARCNRLELEGYGPTGGGEESGGGILPPPGEKKIPAVSYTLEICRG